MGSFFSDREDGLSCTCTGRYIMSNERFLSAIPQEAVEPDYYNVGAARYRGNGSLVPNERFQDARTMNADELVAKYGSEQGMQIVRARAGGDASFNADLTADRSGYQALTDTAGSVANGLFSGLGGIASLGVGLINQDAGVGLADTVNENSAWARENQSYGLNARRRASAAQANNSSADNQARYEQERQSGEGLATIRRIGRNFVDQSSITVSDGTLVADSAAQGVGSLIGGGVVSGGLKAIGRRVLTGVGSRRSASAVSASARIAFWRLRAGGGEPAQ